MQNEPVVTVPKDIIEKWQGVVDILADIMDVPAALIMKVESEVIKVFLANKSPDNPYHPGDSEHLEGSGLYCETVIRNQRMLEIPNALKDAHWSSNPDIKLNMISYLGFPVNWPDNRHFGTICVLDRKERTHEDKKIKYFSKLKELVEMDLRLIKHIEERAELVAMQAEHIARIEEFNKLCMDREVRIIEMKKEVNSLLAELGRVPRYHC